MQSKLEVTAAVLAGGRSLRMGVDKTLLPMDGEALVARVAGVMGEVCAHTVVVTNRPEAMEGAGLSPGVRVLCDEVPYQGPLGGLVTALALAEDDWVLAVAADMPHVSASVVRALWENRGDADIVVPVTEKGPEPLLALYSKRCLPVARRVLASGRRRLVAIFRELRVVELPEESLRRVDPELRSFVNVNTPADLAAALGGSTASTTGADAPGTSSAEEALRGSEEPTTKGERQRDLGAKILLIDGTEERGQRLPVERPITVFLQDREVATMQATPRDLEELAAGFLVVEGFITRREDLSGIDVDQKRGLIWVSTAEVVPEEERQRKRCVTSGCGKGVTFSSIEHARGLGKVRSELRVEAALLLELMGAMARAAGAYRATGGMHACGLACGNELILLREDVGRHNAVDKVIGRAWLDGLRVDDAMLLTTGRISYEMALKAGRAGIPVVVSRTAVTDQAADLARSLGVTLAGYARGRRMTIYTVPHRIIDS